MVKQNRRSWLAKLALAVTGVGFSKVVKAAPVNKLMNANHETAMKLGAFSISLNVNDLAASKAFYETLGFIVLSGNFNQHYFIMKNENALIGLFHGFFEKPILTFNPGWNETASQIDPFEDVRSLQQQLKAKGMKPTTEADEKTSGPASFTLVDPDGNQILIDQHV